MAARHPQCDVGATILRYLATGDNQGQSSLDLEFANSVGVPDPQARAIASRYIQLCDDRANVEEAAAASAQSRSEQESRDAEARASQDAQKAAENRVRINEESKSCATIGGCYSDRRCYSTVTGNPRGRAGAECVYPDGTPRSVGLVNGKIDTAFYQNDKELECFR